MNLIQGITSKPKQLLALALPDGTRATLSLEYRPNQAAWFYSITYGKLIANGRQLVASPNILRAFKNVLPFGIACIGAGNIDPVNIEDFVNGNAALYLLSAQDLTDQEANVFVGY